MQVFNLNKIPDGYEYGGKLTELENYELDPLSNFGIEAAFYWYTIGSCEGSGQIIMLKDGKWALHDMGHCSCYGPTDRMSFSKMEWLPLSELKEKCSSEYLNEVESLVRLAIEKGY